MDEKRPETYVQAGSEKKHPAAQYRERMAAQFGPNWRERLKAPGLQQEGGKE